MLKPGKYLHIPKQALSLFIYAYLAGWRNWKRWLIRAPYLIPSAAGAVGMGCIGFPNHPVWEITRRCNLKCIYCHANGGEPAEGELSTREGKKLIEDLASVKEFGMLVFTGGEPLLRSDIFELMRYSSSLGLYPILATNGTLISEVVKEIKKAGVKNVAIGIDSVNKETYELIRGDKAFEKVMEGIERVREENIPLQLNIAVSELNIGELEETLRFASYVRSDIVLVYVLNPVGRVEGEHNISEDMLGEVARIILKFQRESIPIIEPVGMPQFWSLLAKKLKNPYLLKPFFKGCVAGKGLLYIRADGEVLPCPFLPISAGNIREKNVKEIWLSDFMRSIGDRDRLKGRCGECEYKYICGGCRGRAYLKTKDPFSEDPLCFIKRSHSGSTMTAVP